MTKFLVRTTKPSESQWIEVEAADFMDAAQEFHSREMFIIPTCVFTQPDREKVYFSEVEVQEHGCLFVRTYYSGLYRKGGMQPPQLSRSERLAAIAEKLGWTRPIDDLLAPWEREEKG